MYQKGASPVIPILVVAILLIGGLVFFGTKDDGMMAGKNEEKQTAGVPQQPSPAPVVPVASDDPDTIVAEILLSADEEASISDASADADLVVSDNDAITSYVDAYDTTSF
jgi:hypothetical protein